VNRQRFTRSSRIGFLPINLFLLGHFSGFAVGTQYLAPDALLLSAYALLLYHWPHQRYITISLARTPARHTTRTLTCRTPCPLARRSKCTDAVPDNTHFCCCRQSPTPFCLRTLTLGRWTTRTVLVSWSHSCAEQKLWVSDFAGSSTARGCRLVTIYIYISYIYIWYVKSGMTGSVVSVDICVVMHWFQT
jgi:hypothetical protein